MTTAAAPLPHLALPAPGVVVAPLERVGRQGGGDGGGGAGFMATPADADTGAVVGPGAAAVGVGAGAGAGAGAGVGGGGGGGAGVGADAATNSFKCDGFDNCDYAAAERAHLANRNAAAVAVGGALRAAEDEGRVAAARAVDAAADVAAAQASAAARAIEDAAAAAATAAAAAAAAEAAAAGSAEAAAVLASDLANASRCSPVEHGPQLTLYTLMLGERYRQRVLWGLLHYTRHPGGGAQACHKKTTRRWPSARPRRTWRSSCTAATPSPYKGVQGWTCTSWRRGRGRGQGGYTHDGGDTHTNTALLRLREPRRGERRLRLVSPASWAAPLATTVGIVAGILGALHGAGGDQPVELKLQSYTLESCAHAVLRRRLPAFPPNVLARWARGGGNRGMPGARMTGALTAQQVVRAAEMGARRHGLGRQGRGLR